MGRGLLSVFLALGTGSMPAWGGPAVDIRPGVGVYYFTSDGRKLAEAQSEHGEGDLRFRTLRPPRVVAGDQAFLELQQGNICLAQARQDLQEALEQKKVLDLCKRIYEPELGDALRQARRLRLRPDYLRCRASAEAREGGGSMRMVLSFQAQLVLHDRLPRKMERAGLAGDAKSWPLPAHEAPVGEPGGSWKEMLKAGSCSLGPKVLERFLERDLARSKEARDLARCRSLQVRDSARLARLQQQLRDYVPEEWLAEAGDDETPALLKAPLGADAYVGLAQCRKEREQTKEQLAGLRKLSARIADRHDLSTLDPENQPGGRLPASENGD